MRTTAHLSSNVPCRQPGIPNEGLVQQELLEMNFLPKLSVGLRLVTATGVVLITGPVLAPELAGSLLLDQTGPDGRTQRERFGEAQRVLDRLAAGWRPTEVKFHGAPTLTNWRILVLPAEIIFDGIVHGHPYIADGHRSWTSPLIAVDAVLASWVRTVSRWYRLGRPYREEQES